MWLNELPLHELSDVIQGDLVTDKELQGLVLPKPGLDVVFFQGCDEFQVGRAGGGEGGRCGWVPRSSGVAEFLPRDLGSKFLPLKRKTAPDQKNCPLPSAPTRRALLRSRAQRTSWLQMS